MKQNDNGFISVIIQYRLGAFGFLSSEDVKKGGALNAGLLDMNFALKWVQKYATAFGGDPSRVTIAGESAGGAAVLYQSMAYGGKQKEDLFQNVSCMPTELLCDICLTDIRSLLPARGSHSSTSTMMTSQPRPTATSLPQQVAQTRLTSSSASAAPTPSSCKTPVPESRKLAPSAPSPSSL